MKRLNLLSVLLTAATLFLASCGGTGGFTQPTSSGPAASAPEGLSTDPMGPSAPGEIGQVDAVPPLQNLRPVKVALLLPLSGEHAALGQSMLKAAQMAVFDVGYEGFELMPRDTGATPAQAQQAARSAITEGAEIILGPVFAEDVKAVKPIAQQSNINMVAFTTDQSVAGGNTFVMGFLPYDQIERVIQFSAAQNIKRIGVLAPTTDYGQIALATYQAVASRAGMQTTQVERFAPQTRELNALIRKFSKFEETNASGNTPFDAVFMPIGGDSAKLLASMMSQYNLPPSRVKRIGTGLLDDATLTREPGLEGAWFAAPSPVARSQFENRFRESFGNVPPRLATLSYDATALAAVLAQRGLSSGTGRPGFDRESISNPNGFAGIDGIFRFRPNGTAERGLAVLEIRRGQIVVIDEPPRTFQTVAP